ncbi:MAG: ABC transporter permease [Clostridiales bacterium]|nr:ABC transporter permease [Clostridiales bacterium]
MENEEIKSPSLQAAEDSVAQNPSALAVGGEAEAAIETEAATPLDENVKTLSPFRLVLKRFFRSKLSIVGLSIIIFLFLFSFLGPVIFHRWGELDIDRGKNIAQTVDQSTIETTLPDESTAEITQVIVTPQEINALAAPSLKHWLGTDETGMDVFTRLMFGGRISLLVSLLVVFLETILGVILGGLAGYFGKWVDQVIMRIVDIFMCVPTFPLLLLAGSILDAFEVDPSMRIYYLMMILTLLGWSGTARIVRGQILFLREQEYMVAAEAMGLSTPRKIFKHLVPNVMPQLIVSMTLGLGGTILYEASLSYLGLGVQAPYAAWGTMISIISKNPNILQNNLWVWGPPGVAIILAVLGFNFIGDGLRDALDPRMKR